MAGREEAPSVTSASTEVAKTGFEKKKKKAKKAGSTAAGTETPVEEADTRSESEVDSPRRPVRPALGVKRNKIKIAAHNCHCQLTTNLDQLQCQPFVFILSSTLLEILAFFC